MVSNSLKEITVLCGCFFNETTVLFLASKILVMADTARELSEGLKIKIPNKRSGQSCTTLLLPYLRINVESLYKVSTSTS